MAIRSFLAFAINGELKEKFKHLLNDLQQTHADVKWVKLENIHLTLKFLGSLEEDVLKNISSLLREQCRSFTPLNSYLSKLGAFPNLRHPKIVWGALDDSNKEIQTIVDVLEDQLAKLGIVKDNHPFKPHITLGRIKSSAHLQNLIQTIQQITFADKTEQTFKELILYKSTLTPQGPIYEISSIFPFS